MGLSCIFNGHKWENCKCIRCGKQQDKDHKFILASNSCKEKCEICEKERTAHHWKDCKCDICGMKRDEGHRFVLVHDRCVEKCAGCDKEQVQHHWVVVPGYCVKKCSICGEMTSNHEAIEGNCPKCGKEFLYKFVYKDKNKYSMLLTGLNKGAKFSDPNFDDNIKKLFGQIRDIVAIGIVAPQYIFTNLNQLVDELLHALDGKPIFKDKSMDALAETVVIIKSLEIVTSLAKNIVNIDDETKAKIEAGVSPEPRLKVEYDADGKVINVEVKPGQWELKSVGNSKYYSQNADSLLAACEILKNLTSIPPQTYYLVDTPDGTLGRDLNGFFTETQISTSNLKIDYPFGNSESVISQSLTGFGDMYNNQNSVAIQKSSGQYAKLVLMMKCGKCDYNSFVETVAGDMERQCYCCGTNNKTHRGTITVYTANGAVEV